MLYWNALITTKNTRLSKALLVGPIKRHRLRPPRPTTKLRTSHWAQLRFWLIAFERESPLSAASMSLRLAEVIPLQLASLWYEDQLRSKQWKTRPLRRGRHPHMQINSSSHAITTTTEDVFHLWEPPRFGEDVSLWYHTCQTTKTAARSSLAAQRC